VGKRTAVTNRNLLKSRGEECYTLEMWGMQGLFYGLFILFLADFSRRGKAVRLSYDHKGTDEAEGRRIAAAGGLILNSRVNGTISHCGF